VEEFSTKRGTMKEVDVSIPRRMFWSDKLVNKKKCPLCHSILAPEYHSYVLVTWSGEEPSTFITGNNNGSFCPECPVVVLDRKGFEQIIEEMAESPDLGISSAGRFAVLGIVNTDAIPEDKKHLPPGDDNPIPLVEFLYETDTANRGGEGRHKGKRLSGNQRRRRR
jgi:hypothetical protein